MYSLQHLTVGVRHSNRNLDLNTCDPRWMILSLFCDYQKVYISTFKDRELGCDKLQYTFKDINSKLQITVHIYRDIFSAFQHTKQEIRISLTS